VTCRSASLKITGCGQGDRGICMLVIIIAAVLGAAVAALTTASLKWLCPTREALDKLNQRGQTQS